MITERNSDWPTWPWQTQQKAWGLPRHRWIWASIAWNSLHGTTVMLPLGKKESSPPLRGHMIPRRSPTNAQTHDLALGHSLWPPANFLSTTHTNAKGSQIPTTLLPCPQHSSQPLSNLHPVLLSMTSSNQPSLLQNYWVSNILPWIIYHIQCLSAQYYHLI